MQTQTSYTPITRNLRHYLAYKVLFFFNIRAQNSTLPTESRILSIFLLALSSSLPKYFPSQRDPISDFTIRESRIISVTSVIIASQFNLSLLHLQESFHLALPIIPGPTFFEAAAKWYCSLIENEVNIARRRARHIRVRCRSISTNGLRSFDNLDI